MKRVTVFCALFPALLLVSCGDDSAPDASTDGTVSGDIKGGTISDEMLPLDTLKSQAPSAEPTENTEENAEEEAE